MAGEHGRSSAQRRARAATERAWRQLETEFGLLDAAGVVAVMSRSEPGITAEQVGSRQRDGQLLSTERAGDVRYPGFQFDPGGRVRRVVRILGAVAAEDRWSQNGLILWMCSPCGRLQGMRPVDCLDSPDLVLRAAHESFAASW